MAKTKQLPDKVRDWYILWQADRSVTPERKIADERRFHQYIEPKFGDLSIHKVTERLIRNWLNLKSWEGKEATKYASLMVLRQVLDLPTKALVEGKPLLRKNPAAGIRLESTPTGLATPADILPRDDAESIIEQMDEHYQPLALLALRIGLTWAEAMGLRVEDIDIKGKRILVGHMLGVEAGGIVEVRKRTDEDAPERSVPISTDLQRALAAYLAETSSLRGDFPYLFVTPNPKKDGTPRRPLRPNWNRYVLRPALERAGLPVQGEGAATFHTFRHTAARNMLEDGVSLEEVQRVLGHKSLNTTKRYYQAFVPQPA